MLSDDDLTTEQTLRDIYYSPTQGFRSIENIYQQAKKQLPDLKRSQVVNFLKKQKTHTQFKSHKGPKQFLPTWVRDFDQMQIDLIDFHTAKNVDSKKIDNMSYMLTAIEILSRYAFAIPLKKKSGEATTDTLKTVLSQFHTHFKKYPKIMQFDDGKEFSNPNVKSLLNQYEIQFWVSGTKRKASIVERFNRTLKEKMMKYFSANRTDRWVPILPQLVQNYNSQPHRSIKIAPDKVNQENKHQVWQNLFGKAQGPIPKPKYKVGDLVRVLDYKHTRKDREAWKIFNEDPQERIADLESHRDPITGKVKRRDNVHLISSKQKEKFSDEVFNISEVRLGHPIVYKLYSDQIQGEILGVY